MTLPRQIDIVRSHVEDALAKGGTAVVGGLESVQERFVEPVILTDVPETSSAVCEETFGPTVVVNKVRDLDEAVERANGTSYGLGASIFTKSRSRGRALAERLNNGMVSVNSVLGFAGIPSLPFGGIGESGFGRIHGADGLREFSRPPKAVTVEKFKAPLNLMSLERSERDMKISAAMLKFMHGRDRVTTTRPSARRTRKPAVAAAPPERGSRRRVRSPPHRTAIRIPPGVGATDG